MMGRKVQRRVVGWVEVGEHFVYVKHGNLSIWSRCILPRLAGLVYFKVYMVPGHCVFISEWAVQCQICGMWSTNGCQTIILMVFLPPSTGMIVLQEIVVLRTYQATNNRNKFEVQ